MKNIMKLFFLFLIAGTFFSCEKKIETISYQGGTPPVLSANRSGTIAMSFATKDNEAVTLTWTNPAYQFSTGISSQDVSYLVEIDTTNSNFTNPGRKKIGVSKEMSLSITQNDLNDYLLNQLALAVSVPHNIEIRITSTLLNSTVPLTSNVLKFVITPYVIPPKIAPPSTGKLYLVGSATPGGWNNPVPVPSQQFTQISPTFYQIASIAISGGNSYLFLPLNGDWGVKYGGTGSSNNTNNVNEDDFKMGGSDLLAPTVSGNYKVEVDFQRGRFKLTKL